MNDHATALQKIKCTPEQKAYYDTFGFIVLRQLFSSDEFQEIERAFEQVITQEAEASGIGDRTQLESACDRLDDHKFVIDPGFCDRYPVLLKLNDDDRIAGIAETLLGPGGIVECGSDGSLRSGDTQWHPDEGWNSMIPDGKDDPYRQAGYKSMHYVPAIKIAFYLDALDQDTGCLRVIPGSQMNPFHDRLWSLSRFNVPASELPRVRPQILEKWAKDGGDPQKAEQWFTDDQTNLYDIAPRDVPGLALESQPGDVIFFSHQVWHASYGGSARRMFSVNYRTARNAPTGRP